MNDEEKIILVDDEGNELECEVIDIFEYNGGKFVALTPVEEEGQEEGEEIQVEFMRLQEEKDGDFTLEEIEDDEEFEAVATYWDSLLDEECDEDQD